MMENEFKVKIILNGILVTYGCQQIFFKSSADFSKALEDFIQDPAETMERFNKSVFAKVSYGVSTAQMRPLAPAYRSDGPESDRIRPGDMNIRGVDRPVSSEIRY
jgi:ABC-type transporter lipoprotein component MlaA